MVSTNLNARYIEIHLISKSGYELGELGSCFSHKTAGNYFYKSGTGMMFLFQIIFYPFRKGLSLPDL